MLSELGGAIKVKTHYCIFCSAREVLPMNYCIHGLLACLYCCPLKCLHCNDGERTCNHRRVGTEEYIEVCEHEMEMIEEEYPHISCFIEEVDDGEGMNWKAGAPVTRDHLDFNYALAGMIEMATFSRKVTGELSSRDMSTSGNLRAKIDKLKQVYLFEASYRRLKDIVEDGPRWKRGEFVIICARLDMSSSSCII